MVDLATLRVLVQILLEEEDLEEDSEDSEEEEEELDEEVDFDQPSFKRDQIWSDYAEDLDYDQ